MAFGFLANLIFPRICVACRRRIGQGVVCAACFRTVAVRNHLFCPKCRARLPAQGKICHPEFPYLLGAAGFYDDRVLKALVHYLKFRSIPDAAEPLAQLLYYYVSRMSLGLAGRAVVPVPLSRRRERSRGFNQAELIARRFAGLAGLPLETGWLARTRHTQPQSETRNATERLENIRGAFAVLRPDAVRGRKILLIDDVSTSGATFLEASLALRAAGAKRIIALAAAKA
ncbi:MAG TPA: ComF family protein [Candidatus Paceibacterota bacterium]|nr:ComF family protein [Candidatus Paceibacterota bacterium]